MPGQFGWAGNEEETVLKEGDPAPDFRLPSTEGTEIALSDLRGKWVVLYFFPKADTPG